MLRSTGASRPDSGIWRLDPGKTGPPRFPHAGVGRSEQWLRG